MNTMQLRDFLSMTVPIRIVEIRQSGCDPLAEIAAFRSNPREMERLLLCEGTLFGASAAQPDRHSTGALIHVLSLLAFMPGGVKAFGLHFDAAQSWFYCRLIDEPYRMPSVQVQEADLTNQEGAA